MSGVKAPFIVLCCILFCACFYLSYVQSLVPTKHVIFSVFVGVYSIIANQYIRQSMPTLIPPLITPGTTTTSSTPPIAPTQATARLLFPFTFLFSLAGPTVILLLAGANGLQPPRSHLHAIVAPPLFLIMAQIFCETAAVIASPFFTVYIRFALTLAFVSYRLIAIFDWYSQSLNWVSSAEAARMPTYLVVLAQATALLNIVFWAFSLLCFLLLYCLPALVREPFEENEERVSPLVSSPQPSKKEN